MNETTINAAYASELGVPVGLIIGESGLEEQLFQEKNDARSSLCFPPKNLWDVMQSKIDPCNKFGKLS